MRLVVNSDANFFGFVKVPLIAANSIPIQQYISARSLSQNKTALILYDHFKA